jgi:hypothetical protein
VTRTGHLATALGVGVACLAVAVTPVAASAHPTHRQQAVHPSQQAHKPKVSVLNTAVLSPYQLALAKNGLYVADGGTNTVSRLGRKGLQKIASGPKSGDVAGVAVNRKGDIAYTGSVFGPKGVISSTLTVEFDRGGTLKVDLLKFEQANNPDRRVTYGIDRPTTCQKQAFAPLGGATTKGGIDSHGYAVAALPDGNWVVADAGGNDLLKVTPKGRVSTIAVLPRQATRITKEAAAALKLPDCVIGAVYNFEPVPTDVEVTGKGLVVSLLPGGPEDPSLGARGSVQWVDGKTGESRKLAGSFLGATNVAVGPHGRIYVAELFAGKISVIAEGHVRKYADLPGVLSLEWGIDRLYAGTMAPVDDKGKPTGKGAIVSIK